MTTLAMDCSTSQGSVALVRDGVVIFDESFDAGRGAGGRIFPILEAARKMVERCDRIIVGIGPGSHSGIRITLAAAEGLRLGMGGDLLGVPSPLGIAEREFIHVGDARKGSYHFTHVREGKCVDGPRLIVPEDFPGLVGELSVFCSAPLPLGGPVLLRVPSAAVLGRIEGLGCSKLPLEPLYLRAPHITVGKPVQGLSSTATTVD